MGVTFRAGAAGLLLHYVIVIILVCLTIAAMGVPITLLPLLLAIETIPNVFRTLGNITADITVMRLAGLKDG